MNESQPVTKDLICGMTVDEATACHAEREGQTFYFCSNHCWQTFLSRPGSAKRYDKSGSWKALCAVMMTAAFLGHQPSQGAANDALKSQSSPASAVGPDEDGGNTVESGPPVKLYGTWIANDVDTEMGEVKIKLTFRRIGTVRLLAWSDIPFVGEIKDLKGPYEVHRDTIRSKAIRGGTTAKYSFEGEQLLLQFEDGKVVRFRRE